MKDFFMFETEIPEENGFSLFGPCHMAWLFCIVIFTVCFGYWYQCQTRGRQKRINRVIGTILPVMGLYRDIVLMITGYYSLDFMPFHLCSMALGIASLYVWTNWRWLGVIYVMLCIPGAVGALLFPNWDAYPFFNYMHIHAFLSHGLTLAFGICLLWSDYLVPEWKDFWNLLVFGLLGFVILYWMNGILETNFWFLNTPSHGSPLVWILQMTGEKWYLAGYFLFCLVVVMIWMEILKRIQKYKKHRAAIKVNDKNVKNR